MVRLSSTADAVAAVRNARDVAVLAYTLDRGPVLASLLSAAKRGASVHVRLEGAPFDDPHGALARANRMLVARLRGAGAHVSLQRAGSRQTCVPSVHAKAIVADRSLFVTDRNWSARGVVARDDGDVAGARAIRRIVAHGAAAASDGDAGRLAMSKRCALAQEAALLRGSSRGAPAGVETESFGIGNGVFDAIDALAKRGAPPRLLVCEREAHSTRERRALAHLVRDGVRVRITPETDKIAFAGDDAWIGSANASADFSACDTIDWGTRTRDPAMVEALRERFETNWSRARAYRC
jgi:hypothetical protein